MWTSVWELLVCVCFMHVSISECVCVCVCESVSNTGPKYHVTMFNSIFTLFFYFLLIGH
ncbi:hypothetical protein BDF19DRAFT_431899 [Syncephalis fuscata]|nr:hypothetical protein BDF19DRAFT_431899 [Syncephalis fuscata]